ncbi:hypothetical protein EG68_00444 [Paragonimus skrjabini miyazakii]|uniref:Protoporphyrinogen oxidase n=1 Tax=Paragonimus skrjabini miyazakii TaxID=59628 RepID=A0A8S9ZAB2_9TREM|nr:hypothetical protein EG68_00444 [Paragonimus skrjabini miyazakii]
MASRLPHYCVVGGGISGLSSAYFLSLARPPGSYRLTLLEASPRFGGWIQSVRNPNTGAVYELGPHSARYGGPTSTLLLRLALSLDLQDSLLWMRSNQEAGKKYIYVGGRLVSISPLSLTAKMPFTRSPIGLLARRLFASRPPLKPDLSVDEFLRTRFDDEFADYLGSALMRGVYAGDSRELSARACLSQLLRHEDDGPNLLLGILKNTVKLRSTYSVAVPDVIDSKLPNTSSIVPSRTFAWSLQGGMQTLTEALCSRLRSAGPCITMHTNIPVRRIRRSGDRFTVHWSLDSTTETMIEDVDAVFLTCSSYQSTAILSELLPPGVLKRLKREQLPWASVAVAVFEMDKKSAQPPVRGFGHLVPSTEDENALGVVYDSVAFPQLDGDHQSIRYTVMMKPYSCWLNSDHCFTKEIENKALDILKEHLSLSSPLVIASNVQLHRDCIPQYPLGHVENVKSVRSEISELFGRSLQQSTGIHLVGFSYDGVGLGDAVTSALRAVSAELQLSV